VRKAAGHRIIVIITAALIPERWCVLEEISSSARAACKPEGWQGGECAPLHRREELACAVRAVRLNCDLVGAPVLFGRDLRPKSTTQAPLLSEDGRECGTHGCMCSTLRARTQARSCCGHDGCSAAGLRCLTRAHRPPSAREGRDLNACFRYLSPRASDQACCLAAERIRRLVRVLVSCLCDRSMRV